MVCVVVRISFAKSYSAIHLFDGFQNLFFENSLVKRTFIGQYFKVLVNSEK